MNKGERNELIIKLKLIELRDSKTNINIGNQIFNVSSVGFDEEYKELNEILDHAKINQLSDEELSKLARNVGINKAPGRSKSDVYINNLGVSLKSMESAPPAIVNHTPRNGFEIACLHSKSDILELDKLIFSYWELRVKGIINEDISNSLAISPFSNEKILLAPILNYFLFEGSGAGLSKHRADLILDYSNPFDCNTWRTYNRTDAVDKMWDKLIFSLRSKGMPEKFPEIDKKRFDSVNQWTLYFQEKHRGSLHIRSK